MEQLQVQREQLLPEALAANKNESAEKFIHFKLKRLKKYEKEFTRRRKDFNVKLVPDANSALHSLHEDVWKGTG